MISSVILPVIPLFFTGSYLTYVFLLCFAFLLLYFIVRRFL